MIHIRTMHPETVKTCKFFINGKCDFPDNVCWFMHTKISTSSSPQMLKQFKCGFCEMTFPEKAQLKEICQINFKNGYDPPNAYPSL